MCLKTLCVFGTRPEAIKMAPSALALAADERFDAQVCVTGQHREMLDQVLDLFGLKPDYDLNIMKPGQDLADVTTAICRKSALAAENLSSSPTSKHAGKSRNTYRSSAWNRWKRPLLQSRSAEHTSRNIDDLIV